MDAARPVLRFGTDGVRGVAHEELTPDAVCALARAAARVIGTDRHFLVARDTRESGPMIETALEAGFTAEGAQVESIGVFPTPGLAFLSQARALPAAMISASHNPYRDNGIKLFAPGGRKLPDETEQLVEAQLQVLPPLESADAPGRVEPAPGARDQYLEHVAGSIGDRDLSGLTVVVDCANGAAVETAPLLLERLGATVEVLGAEPDGRNINDGCGSTHPEVLQRAVADRGADVGLAFDGDADRVIAIDEGGEVVDGDQILAVMALDLRDRGLLRHDTVVATVMSNLGFRKAMAENGIDVVETTVGDRYVLEALDEGGYSLGGEQSGHVIFADLATTGDGLLTGVMLLDALCRQGGPMSRLAGVVSKLPQVLHNVRVVDRDGLADAEEFWAAVQNVEEELGADGRVLVRPSGTEPVVRVMIEAPTTEIADTLAQGLSARLADLLGSPRENREAR